MEEDNPGDEAQPSPRAMDVRIDISTEDSAAAASITLRYKAEITFWSTQYNSNAGKFRDRIDAYLKHREEFFRLLQKKTPPKDLSERLAKLGTQLAVAYGMADADAQGWTDETVRRTRTGADEFASTSVQQNWVTSMPGLVKAGVNIVTKTATAFAPYAGQTVEAGFRAAESGWGAYLQGASFISYGVVQLLILGYIPIWAAHDQSETVARQGLVGPTWMPDIKPEGLRTDDGKLQPLLKRQSNFNIDSKLKTKSEKKKKIKIDSQLDADDHTKENLDELVRQTVAASLVVPGQGDNRAKRYLLNAASAASGLASNVNSYVGGDPYTTFALSLTSFGLSMLQPAVYARHHGQETANDNLKKLAATFQMAVLSSAGGFLKRQKRKNNPTKKAKIQFEIDLQKVDRLMKGPLRTRLDYILAILDFDHKVYLYSVYDILVDKFYIDGEWMQEFKSAGLLPKNYDNNERLQTFRRPRLRYNDSDDAKAAKESIAKIRQYINSYSLAKQAISEQNIDGLLKLLPLKSRKLVLKSLSLAACLYDASDTKLIEAAVKADKKLAKLKGYTESFIDTKSVHQAAQKLGQAYTKGVFGSAGSFLISGFSAIIQGTMYLLNGDDLKKIISMVAAGQNVFQIASCFASIGLGYAASAHIYKKTRDRQRDAPLRALPNAGVNQALGFARNFGRISNFDTLLAQKLPAELRPRGPLSIDSSSDLLADTWAQLNAPDLKKALLFHYKKEKGGELNFEEISESAVKELDVITSEYKEPNDREMFVPERDDTQSSEWSDGDSNDKKTKKSKSDQTKSAEIDDY